MLRNGEQKGMHKRFSMKRILVILGPNGVGKSTVSAELLERMPNTAYIDSDTLKWTNPGGRNQEAIEVQRKNILTIFRNYLECDWIQNVIFPYGLHGHRKQMLQQMMSKLKNDFNVEIKVIVLECDEIENVRRMKADGRDEVRIGRALTNTRELFDDLNVPKVDVTKLNVKETAEQIINLLS